MGRPARADTASIKHVGFRLTQDEEARLDELVSMQGHKDRSALLRAWLAQGGPSMTTRTNSASNAPSSTATSTTTRTNYRQTPRTTDKIAHSSKPVAAPSVEPVPARPRHPRLNITPRVMDSSPSSDESSREATKPKSIMRELLAELHRHKGALLIRVPDVVRALMPHASITTIHDALLTLAKHGTIELRPEAGSEFLKPEDAEVCPRGPRETVFSYARWTDTSTR